MADEVKKPVPGRRADARRNRQHLLEVARQAFAERGTAVSLGEIARLAEVGIGTLYRHFPTREALVEQVYRAETERLAEAARRLSAELPPLEALRQWLRLFVDYLAAKRVMTELLSTLPSGTAELHASSGQLVRQSVAALAERAAAEGAIVLRIAPLDLLRAIFGVATAVPEADWQAAAHRLIDVLLAGLARRGG